MNNSDPNYKEINYRDKISTVDMQGKRIFLHPKKPKGRFTNWRKIVGYFLLLLMVLMPVVKVSGNPLVLINLIERKFVIFGVMFFPQDTFILLVMMLSFLVFIILFTATFGRIFCGWACPQTIFLEIIFRPIEYLIDGDSRDQIKLKNAPWTGQKIFKRVLKHSIFFIISLALVNIIMWYFMSFDKWLLYAQNYQDHLGGILTIIAFSIVFHVIYSHFREQICLIVCPYGRIQGVLLDPKSIVVSYDYKRGEPRGKKKKDQVEEKGDCIDCKACVDVCPTGIDIRNGTQLECVNCTACIDACDNVMDKVGKPRGLVRYASEKEIVEGKQKFFNVRNIAYTIVLSGLVLFFIGLLATRSSVETRIIRAQGMLYQEIGTDTIQNLYNIKATNKTYDQQVLDIQLVSHDGTVKIAGGTIVLEREQRRDTYMFIKLPKSAISSERMDLQIEININNEEKDVQKVNFIAPPM
jgi:cytochrome c oxidase accessory protein FixG